MLLVFALLIACSSGRTVTEATNVIPSLEDTPDKTFVLLLGPQFTEELAAKDFEDEALNTVVKKMFTEVDQDADSLLDKRELALWLHKNDMINKAADIKEEFLDCDTNKDRQLTFKEFAIHGGLDSKTTEFVKEKFLAENGELDTKDLTQQLRQMVKSENRMTFEIISDFLKLFIASDEDKSDALSWEEFFMFSYPEDHSDYDMLFKGKPHRHDDVNGDLEYDFDEFDSWYSSYVIIPELLPKVQRTPRGMFDSCDEDKNGTLSYAEIDKCRKGHIDHTEPDYLLEEGDLNEDGKLSVEEIVEEFHNLVEDDDYMMDYHDEF